MNFLEKKIFKSFLFLKNKITWDVFNGRTSIIKYPKFSRWPVDVVEYALHLITLRCNLCCWNVFLSSSQANSWFISGVEVNSTGSVVRISPSNLASTVNWHDDWFGKFRPWKKFFFFLLKD